MFRTEFVASAGLKSKTTLAWALAPFPRRDSLGPSRRNDGPSCRALCCHRPQEPGNRVERRQSCGRVDRLEQPRDETRLEIHRRTDIHAEWRPVHIRRVDARLERLQAIENADHDGAELDVAELKARPIEIRVELLGDSYLLGRDRSLLRIVLELDTVRQRLRVLIDPARGADSRWTEEVVGVKGKGERDDVLGPPSAGCVRGVWAKNSASSRHTIAVIGNRSCAVAKAPSPVCKLA